MARFNTVEVESIQAGVAPILPLATVDVWPSLDPTTPFSVQSTGINNFPAITNQIGLYNGVGLWSQIGSYSGVGQGIFVGGHNDAQPYYDSSSPSVNFNSPDGDLNGFWKFNGSVICTAPCSDRNAKKNIEPLENSLDKILNLNGVSFDWNEDVVPNLASTQGHQIGLIAQEVEQVVPEVVTIETVENKQLKSINYEVLTSLLIEAVKEQQEQINTLKQTVHELSTKLAECCP